MEDLIQEMRNELMGQLSEWLGFDIPEEGTDDYETWQSRLREIEEIRNFSDVYDYLDGDDERAQEFFESFGVSNFKSKI